MLSNFTACLYCWIRRALAFNVPPLPVPPCSGPFGALQPTGLPTFSWVLLDAGGQPVPADGLSFECSVKAKGERGGEQAHVSAAPIQEPMPSAAPSGPPLSPVAVPSAPLQTQSGALAPHHTRLTEAVSQRGDITHSPPGWSATARRTLQLRQPCTRHPGLARRPPWSPPPGTVLGPPARPCDAPSAAPWDSRAASLLLPEMMLGVSATRLPSCGLPSELEGLRRV